MANTQIALSTVGVKSSVIGGVGYFDNFLDCKVELLELNLGLPECPKNNPRILKVNMLPSRSLQPHYAHGILRIFSTFISLKCL